MTLPLILLALPIFTADLSGTWIAESGAGTPMCLALSQQGQEVTGNMAYEKDRKFAEIRNGTLNGNLLDFQVNDMDHGTMQFHFTLSEGKLSGEDHALLSKYTRKLNGTPSVISKVDPEYSEEARQQKLSGNVKLSVEILSNGAAGDIKVLYSLGKGLDESAISAVRQWKFTPRVTLEVNFRLL